MRSRLGSGVLLASLAAIAFCGCGASGGSTTCNDFRGMSTSDQRNVVSSIIKEHGGNPSPLSVDVGWVSAKAYCFTHSGTDTVGGITGG